MKKNNQPHLQQEYRPVMFLSDNTSYKQYGKQGSKQFGKESGKECSKPCNTQHDKACDEQCTVSCPHFDLCKKHIFIVGGVERMEALYRNLVEGNGGFLDYHSGSMQGGIKKLEKCLHRADLIICPINCNSHGACVKVKNMAKKFGKNFHMLPTGSLSAIKRLLQESYSS